MTAMRRDTLLEKDKISANQKDRLAFVSLLPESNWRPLAY